MYLELMKNNPVIQYIMTNITEKKLEIWNATTQMVLKVMEEIKKINKSTVASRSMITFLALNTSGLTLIPTTVIAIRMQYKSVAPTEIVGTTIIATVITTLSAVILDRLFYYMDKNKRGE